ncbi:UNKNOWN [Stylonychia lemnae]|uniref:FUZ/MON1/HPS1 first Longin domain-containing protein n=1 Tax=Stylonychia lemnae TaxID=5949 RepID=A0A078B8L6_STYLE|nr:UNKNOWN [Stylonychia lemnae]|eukprot:CDW90546.1 UNKNOWN [Stylonychia lemnae]
MKDDNFDFQALRSDHDQNDWGTSSPIKSRSRKSSLVNSSFDNLAQNEEEEKELESFFTQEKIFIILTNSGKPVFCNHGDIYSLSPIIATMYAILSKIQTLKTPEKVNKFMEQDIEDQKQQESNRLTVKLQNRISQTIWKRREEENTNTTTQPTDQDQLLTSLLPQDQFSIENDEKISRIRSLNTLISNFKVCFLHKGDCLIYIGLSKDQNESQTAVKRQLENLHSQLISLTTQNLIKNLKLNPSYDVISNIIDHHQLINNHLINLNKDPQTFLNQYLPLRLHQDTKLAIEQVVKRFKFLLGNIYYYGLVLAERTVVTTIKDDSRIVILPLAEQGQSFDPICLPGMSENFRINLFTYFEQDSVLKIVFVTEESTPEIGKLLEQFCTSTIYSFKQLGIIDNVQDAEVSMFARKQLGEIQHAIVSNGLLDQYTCFNFPLIEPDLYSLAQMKSLQEYEKLYDRYLVSSNKAELFIKKVYALETYDGTRHRGDMQKVIIRNHD